MNEKLKIIVKISHYFDANEWRTFEIFTEQCSYCSKLTKNQGHFLKQMELLVQMNGWSRMLIKIGSIFAEIERKIGKIDFLNIFYKDK